MEPIIKSRDKYEKRLKELDRGGICGFCNLDRSFLIKEFKHWLWVYSEFPYWKYNTIVVSKSHKIKFSQLSVDEMFELREIFSKVEKVYLEAGITKDNAGWGMDILWRQRVNTSGFETRSHIHITCVLIKKVYLPIFLILKLIK